MTIISMSFLICMAAAAEENDVHVEGPIDNQWIVTLTYRGYTYQKIVTGKPDSPKNMKLLEQWEDEKMEERDAAVPNRKTSSQFP
jgi:hypothetical protein